MTLSKALVAIVLIIVVGLAVLFAITPAIDRRRQRILRKCLRDVCDLLNAHQIDYWLDFGTLLGCFRDHDVIRSDYDVDLSILASVRPGLVALIADFKTCGYSLRDANGTTRRVIRITHDRSGYYVDIYHFTPDGPWLRSPYRPEEDVPDTLIGDRMATSFLGGEVRVPRDVEALLVYRYGADFMTPRRGDRGPAFGFSRVETLLRILENNCVGVWSLLKSR